jgi:hypothetical protein
LADKVLPPPADLRAFWERAATAIQSLDPSFADFESAFELEHVKHFGPHVLGFLGWQQVAVKPMRSWFQFRQQVELVFGLSQE